MFLDLEYFKRKVSWSDSAISIQDTLIIRQAQTIKKKEAEIDAVKNSEKQANFKADFFEKFADKQQNLVIKTLQKQNRNYLIGGAIIGILITLMFTK